MERKILFITYENPFTKNTGDSIYTCNILDGLFNLSKLIDIIYFDSNPTESLINEVDSLNFQQITVIKFIKKNPFNFIFSLLPGMIVNRKSKEYIIALENTLRKKSYDTIVLNHQKMMFTLPIILKHKRHAKLIYSSHNVEYLLSTNLVKYSNSIIKKLAYWQDAIKTKHFEKKWISQFDGVTAISEHDADYFQNEYKMPKVDILRPVFEENKKLILNYQSKKSCNLIIAGSFDWKPKKDNLLLFLNAKNFRSLKENGIFLTIVGRANPEFVDFVNKNYDGINMTGEVESLLPYYETSKIAIVPERLGGGFKLKIVEAALLKTAIFSIKGAITRCNFIGDVHFIEKNSFEELIDEIILVQKKPELLNDLIENAFSVAKNDFTFDKITESLKNVI